MAPSRFEDARIYGKSKLHTFHDGWRVLKELLRHRFARRGLDDRIQAGVIPLPEPVGAE